MQKISSPSLICTTEAAQNIDRPSKQRYPFYHAIDTTLTQTA